MVLVVTAAEQGTTCSWAFLNPVEIFLFIMVYSKFPVGLALVVIIWAFFLQQHFQCWRHIKSLALLKDNGSFEMLKSSDRGINCIRVFA